MNLRWGTAIFVLFTIFRSIFSIQGANQDPAQFEGEIRAFEASDATNPPPKGAVLFVGSSSIRVWTNLAESFPNFTTIRRGFGGSHLPDSIAFADRIIFPYAPAQIVLYAGENDIARGDAADSVYYRFRDFVRIVQKRLPETQIFFVSIKPAPARWHLAPQEIEANRLIRKFCERHEEVFFIDIWPSLLAADGKPDERLFQSDHLHLNGLGYRRWAEAINSALVQQTRCCE